MFFSQILVAMFRLMMLALLAPFLVAAFGFPWGRPMAFAGLRTALGAVMVLFAATAAVSLALSGINSLEIKEIKDADLIKDIATLTNAKFVLMIIMGWLGASLMMVGTELANSIVGTLLTNTAAGMMTAGMTGAAMSLAKFANPLTAGSRIAGIGQKMGAEGDAWGTIKGAVQGKEPRQVFPPAPGVCASCGRRRALDHGDRARSRGVRRQLLRRRTQGQRGGDHLPPGGGVPRAEDLALPDAGAGAGRGRRVTARTIRNSACRRGPRTAGGTAVTARRDGQSAFPGNWRRAGSFTRRSARRAFSGGTP